MDCLLSLWSFFLGVIVGSFLNVVIYRYNTGFTLRGRSQCLVCGHQLRWLELIPVVSFLIQRGRCRKCRARISWQYPLVELTNGLLFLFVWQLHLSLGLTALYWAIFSLLLVILVYDLRHMIIPDGLVFAFIILAAGVVYFIGGWSLVGEQLLAGLALAGFFALLWAVSRGRWMGFGDAKLGLGVGLLLGMIPGISAIILSFWLGAAAGVGLIVWTRWFGRRKKVGMKSEVPFAPFIIVGLVLVFFFHWNLLHF